MCTTYEVTLNIAESNIQVCQKHTCILEVEMVVISARAVVMLLSETEDINNVRCQVY